MVTVWFRQSMNSMREDVVSGPDVKPLAGVSNVIDIDPPSAHGNDIVRDWTLRVTVIVVFSTAWLMAAATMFCVVEVPGPDAVGGFNWEGADGP